MGTRSRPTGKEKRCSLVPYKSRFFPSSGAVGLWVAGLASLPFCIIALFDLHHYTLLCLTPCFLEHFFHVHRS